MEAKSLSVVEHAHISEMQEDLTRKLKESQKVDGGSGRDMLRRSVLSTVVAENYDEAKDKLSAYVNEKSEFPAFQARVERYVQHCLDLIQAIHTKRNFPGLATLSLSKQQEIHEKVLEHFEELKQYLKHIEKVERDHKLTDVRSTVWVLQAACLAVAAVVLAIFIADLNSGLLSSLVYMVNLQLDEASTWLINAIL